ncbi:MAG: glycosyltransferase family 2 protein [Pseudomonadota bacterium]
MDRFAFVIPVFNHSETISEVVKQAQQTGYPVFVVDDGSTDNTPEILKNLTGITLLCHSQNRGKGAALQTGFKEAAKIARWAITVDADGQHNPQEALNLVQAIPTGERPIVIGRRQGMDCANTPWTSQFGRSFSNFWIRAAGGHRVLDSQSGFRMYPMPETLELDPKTKRFQFEVEILVLAKWKGIPLIEAPVQVQYDPPGKRVSHFRPFVDFWRNAGTFSRLITRRMFVPRAVRSQLRKEPEA